MKTVQSQGFRLNVWDIGGTVTLTGVHMWWCGVWCTKCMFTVLCVDAYLRPEDTSAILEQLL